MLTSYIRDNYTTMSRVLSLLLLFTILIVYRPVLTYPFVSDDWFQMNFFVMSHSNQESLGFCFAPWKGRDLASFRPIGYLYMLLLYNLFGLNPVVFKIFALFFHFINSLLIIYIVRRILGNPVIAWTTGLLYANAVKIHIHPLIWCTGIFDLGGQFFFCSSFALFLKRRYKMSAMTYLLALFTKPATYTLPLILLSYVIFIPEESRKISLIRSYRKLWFHFLLFFVYSILIAHYVIYISPNYEDCLQFAFFGPHLLKNFTYYVSLGIPAIFTFKSTAIMYILSFIALMTFIRLKQNNTHVEYRKYKTVFWIIWFILGLVPPTFISDGNRNPYYLTYSLVPFIVLFLLFIRSIAIRSKCREKQLSLIVTVVVIFSFVSSSLYCFKEDRQGIHSEEHMIRSAYVIKTIYNKLLEAYPSLPKGAVLIFEGIERRGLYGLFCHRNYAPRTWYRDNTLEVCVLEDLYANPDGVHIKISPNEGHTVDSDEDIQLGRERAFFLVSWNDGNVRARKLSLQELYELSELNKSRINQSDNN